LAQKEGIFPEMTNITYVELHLEEEGVIYTWTY